MLRLWARNVSTGGRAEIDQVVRHLQKLTPGVGRAVAAERIDRTGA